MNSKPKILIGFLVIGIVLISAWWVWNFIGEKEVTLTTNKMDYNREENISLTVLNNLNRNIIVSSCPTGEGFVRIEKKDELDKWQEMSVSFPMAVCTGPLTLRSGESHTYLVLMNTREIRMPKLGEVQEKYFGDPGIYRIKFGYLTSLLYSRENTHWIYSNEFIIK